jgi:SAM-dependent methyltransferase
MTPTDAIRERIAGELSGLIAARLGELTTGAAVSVERARAEAEEADRALRACVAALPGMSRVSMDQVPVESPRPLLGWFVTGVKRLIRKAVFWLLEPEFVRISGYQSASAQVMMAMIDRLAAARAEYAAVLEAVGARTRTSLEAARADLLAAAAAHKADVVREIRQASEGVLSVASAWNDEFRRHGFVTRSEMSACREDVREEIRSAAASLRKELGGAGEGTRPERRSPDPAVEATLGQLLSAAAAHKEDVVREVRYAAAAWQTEADAMRAEVAFLRNRLASRSTAESAVPAAAPVPDAVPSIPAGPASPQLAEANPDSDWLYLRFEDSQRGPETLIRDRQRAYLPDISAASDRCGKDAKALDLGCGRGEFLELCREAGVPAEGVDSNGAMVARCREKGLEARQGDLLSALADLRDESLAGVTAFQVVEHLPPPVLVRFIRSAALKLKPGGVIILETINPACPEAMLNFWMDLTHERPLMPATLRFLVKEAGFRDVQVRYASPAERPGDPDGREPSRFQDYAVIGTR